VVCPASLGTLDANLVAERALRRLAGTTEATLTSRRRDCHASLVRPRLFAQGRAAVEAHQRAGDVVAIVTAATAYAARPVAEDLGIAHIIATTLAVSEDG